MTYYIIQTTHITDKGTTITRYYSESRYESPWTEKLENAKFFKNHDDAKFIYQWYEGNHLKIPLIFILNITKDLIGAKGYYEDVLETLRNFPNNENLTIGEVVDFNDSVIFIRDKDGYVVSSGWQFFYLVEMPKEKQEKWWIVPTYSPFTFTDSNSFNEIGYCYRVEPQKDSYSKSYPPLKSDFNSKEEEAEKWLKEYLKTSDELEINGVLDFSKSNTTMKNFQNEFLRLCEDFNISFGGSFYELDRNGKRK